MYATTSNQLGEWVSSEVIMPESTPVIPYIFPPCYTISNPSVVYIPSLHTDGLFRHQIPNNVHHLLRYHHAHCSGLKKGLCAPIPPYTPHLLLINTPDPIPDGTWQVEPTYNSYHQASGLPTHTRVWSNPASGY